MLSLPSGEVKIHLFRREKILYLTFRNGGPKHAYKYISSQKTGFKIESYAVCVFGCKNKTLDTGMYQAGHHTKQHAGMGLNREKQTKETQRMWLSIFEADMKDISFDDDDDAMPESTSVVYASESESD